MTAPESMPTRPTVLIVFDGKAPSATQNISFVQPFDCEAAPVLIRFARDCSDLATIGNAMAEYRPDLLVLSRYTAGFGDEWIRLARQAGTPVIFHIDDDLLAVPESLGPAKYKAYNDPERVGALRRNIEGSDLLYVSTRALAERFSNHKIQAPIFAGDIYCSVAPDEIGSLVGAATGPVIGYMGTAGHSADLRMILPAICDVLDLVPSAQFEVFGTIEMPPELARFGARARHLAPVNGYAEFKTRLRSLGWWVGLAPLEDNPFNRCKADTKWVEYSLAGMAVVASDIPVYHRACANGGGMLAVTPADWTDAIMELLQRPDLRRATVTAAQDTLRKGYTHEVLRRQVMQVFDRADALARERLKQPLPTSFRGEQPRLEH